MTLKVAINGFGRIGRMVLRALVESKRTDIHVMAINDLAPLEASVHLLQYDSVHGPFQEKVSCAGDTIQVAGQTIQGFSEADPKNLPWGDLGIDMVFECSGFFTEGAKAQAHIDAGAKRVLISAPGKNVDQTIVYGVNHTVLSASDCIVSNASCTTNCLAPVVQTLHQAIGLEKGYMTTIHAYTGDQRLIDTNHKDLRRARAGALNMIPTSTGAAKAVGLVLPELDGKLDGVAIRVPTPNVSMVDLTFVAERETSADEINDALKSAAQGVLEGVMEAVDLPLVSTDFNHNPHSSIADLTQTSVVQGTLCRVVSWYDNEWGFSNRMLDTAVYWGSL